MSEKMSQDENDSEENNSRGTWDNQVEFILTLIGYAVGIGNIWRFPYFCMKNGGGAFLIPYFFFLAIGGIPLFYLELYLGQFSSSSPIIVWKIAPLFKGLGWGMCTISFIGALYYNIIISWVLYFLGSSFTLGDLPWATCSNTWNTAQCVISIRENITATNLTNTTATNFTYITTSNFTNQTNVLNGTTTPAEEFWENYILGMSNGIDTIGNIRWQNFLCLLSAWLLVYFCMIKGIKTTGKVVYVTATLPYILLVCLFVRGITLPGAWNGIKFYIVPDWSKLLSSSIWVDACLQIFYSLGPAWGGLMAFASFNKFNNNIKRDGIVIPLVNCFTSFFGGFVIFSIIGFLSHESGLPVETVIKAGPGLAFVAYPSAIARMPFAPAWAIVFFLTLLTIGIDTQFGVMETFIMGVLDLFPNLLKYKPLINGIICLLCLLAGLILTTNAGIYFFQIIDWYCGVLCLTLTSILECIIVSWIYGNKQVSSDIKMMLGTNTDWYMIVCWTFVTPVVMAVSFCYSLVTMVPPQYGSYIYPSWALNFGWTIATIPLLPIPICAVIQLVKSYKLEKSFLKALMHSLHPSQSWGPRNKEYRNKYVYNGNMARFYQEKPKDPATFRLRKVISN